MTNSAPDEGGDYNAKIIKEFRANQGRVGGPWADTHSWRTPGKDHTALSGVHADPPGLTGSREPPAFQRRGVRISCNDNASQRRTDIGKIIISENVSLDGVIQDPAGEEGFRHGGWFGQVGNKDREELAKVLLEEALGTAALLLDRRSYEYLAARWPSRNGEWADRLNSMPKYVVSSTLEHPVWNNVTVLKGDVVTEVAKLTREIAGDIVVYASFQLGRTLMEQDLVDEVRLMIYPVALGAGERLFGETSDKKPMRLISTRTVGDSLAFLTYARLRDA